MIVSEKSHRGDRTLRIPITEEDYQRFMSDRAFAREVLNQLFQKTPELFPETFGKGYTFNGTTPASIKQGYRLRRFILKSDGTTFSVAPAFLMPYMVARTHEVENALFLRRFNVPYWGLTHIFGHNDMYWYRIERSLGRLSIVGATIKHPDSLPNDLLADEKHTKVRGEKHFIAMTVAKECILGAEMTNSASEASLTEAYSAFAKEARSIKPDYAPQTVNTDGWAATQNAWQKLFPMITVILCFLHAFIKIRDRATKIMLTSFNEVAAQVWEAYRAPTKASFSQRVRRLREWTTQHVPESVMKTHVLDLCAKRDRFSKAYAYEQGHRTSNMVDRLIKVFDRACFDAQYFHGSLSSGQQSVRAWALLWNFTPSSPITVKKYGGRLSPAERLNAKRYADHWLENLLISGSMNGRYGHQQIPL